MSLCFQFSDSFFVNTGEIINDRDRCPQCRGAKVSKEKKVLEVRVDKGMQHGQKIVFTGEADEAVSKMFPHSVFT